MEKATRPWSNSDCERKTPDSIAQEFPDRTKNPAFSFP